MTNKPSNFPKANLPRINQKIYLTGKVVLLVGNDIAVLQTIIIQLAQKGADVALICQILPGETLRDVREGVEAVGRRLLIIEETDRNPVSAERLIQTVISQLGHLDIFIDLLGQKRKFIPVVTERQQVKEWFPSNWSLMQAALQEMSHP